MERQNQIALLTHSNKEKRNGLKEKTSFELYASSLHSQMDVPIKTATANQFITHVTHST